MQEFAEILGCKVGSFPAKYLRLPLCLGPVKKIHLESCGGKFGEKIIPVELYIYIKKSLWKANYLSLGGRITLVVSVLFSLPIFFLSILKCLILVVNHKEKLQTDFLWHGRSLEKKFHLMDWKSVCKLREEVGLGIRSLKCIN